MTSVPDKVKTKQDLIRFVEGLQADLVRDPGSWENADLPRFLEALGAWIASSDPYHRNIGAEVPDQPSWAFVASALLAAKYYE